MNNLSDTIVSHYDPRSPASEAYRMLRTNLQFSSPDNPLRSIVVTSATPREGKSTTGANLAVTFAQAGKKVLLIDGDMRKATIHKFFGLNNTVGLSSLIVGDGEFSEVVQKCWQDNLDIITSGPIPPNPAELLSSNRAKQLISAFEEEYDLVIIDSPPVAAVSDALIISTLVTGTLVVVNYGAVPKDIAKKVVDQLHNVKANIVGVVINRMPMKGAGYLYYDYAE